MQLLLVQHAEATTKTDDPSRPLTTAGAESAEKMAIFAARHGVVVCEIRHSEKLRAKQTAEIFAEPLEPSGGVTAVPGLAPDDDVQPVAEALARLDLPVMLVGHMPFMSRLAGLLLVGDADASPVQFRNAGIVCLVRTESSWAVSWAMTPEVLAS